VLAETWTGPTNGSWFDAPNWQGGLVPGAGTVTTDINNGTVVQISPTPANPEGAANAGQTLNISNPNTVLGVINGASLAFGAANVFQGGTLSIGDASVTGNINLSNGAVVFFPSAGNSITYAGAISGSDISPQFCNNGAGGCTGLNINSGTVVLSGANPYTGQTTIFDGATLKIGVSNTLQNSIVILQEKGTLDLNGINATLGGIGDNPNTGKAGNLNLGSTTLTLGQNGGSAEYSGVISGSGGLAKVGGGTQTLTANNTYTGSTTIAQGTLQLGNGGTGGGILGDVKDNGSLIFNRSDSFAFGGAISGSGELVKAGAGTLTLSGTNAYSGGTRVDAGILAGDTASLQGNILDNAQVVFNQAADGTFAGSLSGSGSLVKDGAGTLTLAGANSYAGGTTISAGALAGDTDSLQGDIVDNGRLVFNQAQDDSFAGSISGTGGLVKQGAGELILEAPNTYSGGTTVEAGTLGGDSASLQGDIANNSQVAFHQDGDGTYAGAISGSGSLLKDGAGTLALTGNSTYTGLTTIAQGALQLGNGGAAGGVLGDVEDNGTLIFNRSDSFAFGGAISGSGELVKAGAGTLTLSGTNAYSGGTRVDAGILAGDTASLQGNILNNAQVVFNQAADGTFAGGLSGSGSLVKDGAGILTLAGANSYTGGTTISAGALAVNAASLQGNIVDNGRLVFNQAQNGSFAGSISGVGGLVKQGAGELVLNGANTYSGGTTVEAGTLGGDSASLQGNIANNSQVAFHQGSDGVYAGVISGSGGLLKDGAGTLALTGANTYAGETRIEEGALAITGGGQRFLGGDVFNQGTVSVQGVSAEYGGSFNNDGAYISNQATSTFNNLTVGANGYLAGGANDEFVVTGNFLNTSAQADSWKTDNARLVFRSASPGQPGQHVFQLAGTDKGASGQAAKNNFSWGSLTLDSGNLLQLTDGNAKGQRPALYVQRLVLPDGKSQLSSISSDFNIYFNGSNAENQYLQDGLSFGSGAGQLLAFDFSPQLVQSTAAAGLVLTPDQLGFAVALDQSCSAGALGALAARCQELQGLSPLEKKQAAAQLTPDQAPAQTGLGTQFRINRMDVPLARLASLRLGQTTPLSFNFNGVDIAPRALAAVPGSLGGGGAAGDDDALRDPPLGVYVQGRYVYGHQAQTIWQRGYHFNGGSVTAGADYRFSDQLVAGAMFTYMNTDAQYGQYNGSLRGNNYLGALYGSYYLPMDFFVDWVANYGGQDYSFSRRYTYPGYIGKAQSQPEGNQFGFTLNLGKDVAWEGWLFSPYTRFEYTNLHIDAYQERGGDGFNLAVGGQTAHSFVSDLGLQMSHAFGLSWGVLTPGLRVEWEHQYLNNNRQEQMTLVDATAGTGTFIIQTGRPDRDYVNLGGSVVATLPNGGSGFLRFESRLGQSDVIQHVFELGVRMSF
jgi:autotransporter-associated beta strand protein